uniref:Os01g0705300 protein n=1 Tax=Macrostomum lignano TaxID=282301 RepID=A0A1I8F583_9PLAT
ASAAAVAVSRRRIVLIADAGGRSRRASRGCSTPSRNTNFSSERESRLTVEARLDVEAVDVPKADDVAHDQQLGGQDSGGVLLLARASLIDVDGGGFYNAWRLARNPGAF